MNKLLYNTKVILVLFVLLLTACTSSDKRLTLNTKEDLTQIKQLIGENTKILELNLTTINPRQPYLEQIIYQNKDDYIIYSYPYNNVVKQKSILSKKQKHFTPISSSDFNVEEFIKIKNKAIALIKEKSTNFTDFSVEKIVYSTIGNHKLSYSFQIIGLKQNDKISYIGKKVYPKEKYYRFSFYYDTGSKHLKSIGNGF